MSSTHTEATLFLPQPTSQQCCLCAFEIYSDFEYHDAILCVFLHLLLLNSELTNFYCYLLAKSPSFETLVHRIYIHV